jgi:hypothetical protein
MFVYLFMGLGFLTQGFAVAKQVLYPLEPCPHFHSSPFSLFLRLGNYRNHLEFRSDRPAPLTFWVKRQVAEFPQPFWSRKTVYSLEKGTISNSWLVQGLFYLEVSV